MAETSEFHKEDIRKGALFRRKLDKSVCVVYDVGDFVELRDLYGNADSTLVVSVATVLNHFTYIPIEDTSRFERVLHYDVMGEKDDASAERQK